MNPKDLTKTQRRRMSELAGLAYQRDLSVELAKLEAEFVTVQPYRRERMGALDAVEVGD